MQQHPPSSAFLRFRKRAMEISCRAARVIRELMLFIGSAIDTCSVVTILRPVGVEGMALSQFNFAPVTETA